MVQSEGVTLFNDSNGGGKIDEFYPLRSGPTTGPLWQRLAWNGGSVNGSYSVDGVTWTALAQTLTLNNGEPGRGNDIRAQHRHRAHLAQGHGQLRLLLRHVAAPHASSVRHGHPAVDGPGTPGR